MENQSDRNMEESPNAGPEVVENGASVRKGRLRRSFGFLGSFTFWVRLGVGLVILGAGVLIGLGIARFIGDSQGSDDHGRRDENFFALRVDPSGEWFGEGALSPDGKRFRSPAPEEKLERERNGWKDKKFEEGKFGSKEFPFENGSYLPDEALERVERLIEKIEQLIEKVVDYLEEEDFEWFMDRFFGPGWFEDGFWGDDDEGRRFGDEYREGDGESKGDQDDDEDDDSLDNDEDEDFREEDNGKDQTFEGFGLPFGDLLPGLAFLEDCELDLEKLPDLLENLPDPEGDGFEDGEDLDEFFAQIDELFRDVCETPSDN